MDTLKLSSGYAKEINPFRAAILSGWNADDRWHQRWRCIAATLVFIAIGSINVL
jgi:hypothetical protein